MNGWQRRLGRGRCEGEPLQANVLGPHTPFADTARVPRRPVALPATPLTPCTPSISDLADVCACSAAQLPRQRLIAGVPALQPSLLELFAAAAKLALLP